MRLFKCLPLFILFHRHINKILNICTFIFFFVFYYYLWFFHAIYSARSHSSVIHKIAVVTQFYMTEAENEYVIKGNAAVMKCKIPSFVADFVQVEAWIIAEDGAVLTASNDSSASYGYFSLFFSLFNSRHYLICVCVVKKSTEI